MTKGGFQEYTFTIVKPGGEQEVDVGVDVLNGSIHYVNIDAQMRSWWEEHYPELGWAPSQNPLFMVARYPKNAFKAVSELGICTEYDEWKWNMKLADAAKRCAWYITAGLSVEQITTAYERLIREALS